MTQHTKASAAIVKEFVTTYPNPGVVTVILEIVFPATTTVAIAPVPVPPANDTFVYVAFTPSVCFTLIVVINSSAVVTNFPAVFAVVTSNVKPVPPDGDTVVTCPTKDPAVPSVPPEVKDASKLPFGSGIPLSISLNTGEDTAEVNDPDVTVVSNNELSPFWKY